MSDPNAPRRGGSITIPAPEVPADATPEERAAAIYAAVDAALRGPAPEEPAAPAQE